YDRGSVTESSSMTTDQWLKQMVLMGIGICMALRLHRSARIHDIEFLSSVLSTIVVQWLKAAAQWSSNQWLKHMMQIYVRLYGIKPSLFEQFKPQDQVVDEYTFTKFLGRDEAKRQLHDHWSSWVTEQDIKKLASFGLNHLRIPVGYWAFEKKSTEPFIMDSFNYLLKAVRWAKKYGMRVIVDLHGAPGSQNGYHHSGKHGPIEWQTGDNIHRTLNVIKNMTETFSRPEFRNTVTIIGVLNEPKPLVKNQFNEYFKDAYKIIREKNSDILILYDATFLQVDDSIKFLKLSEFKKVALDINNYYAFTCNFVTMSINEQLVNVCSNYYNISSTSQDVLRFVGEWSLSTTHGSSCKYSSNTCQFKDDYRNWTSEHKIFLKQYASAQMDAYEAGIGWTFWNFKTECSTLWNFMLGVEQGWMPLTYKQRTYDCS
ncbi:12617_t:CDS:2, partial [Ambispora leptoticha]